MAKRRDAYLHTRLDSEHVLIDVESSEENGIGRDTIHQVYDESMAHYGKGQY